MSEVCFVNKKSTNDLFFFAFTNSQDIRRVLITPCFDFFNQDYNYSSNHPPDLPTDIAYYAYISSKKDW